MASSTSDSEGMYSVPRSIWGLLGRPSSRLDGTETGQNESATVYRSASCKELSLNRFIISRAAFSSFSFFFPLFSFFFLLLLAFSHVDNAHQNGNPESSGWCYFDFAA